MYKGPEGPDLSGEFQLKQKKWYFKIEYQSYEF